MLESRLAMAAFAPGNLLISSAPFGQTPMLYEVTPAGAVVQQAAITHPSNVVTERPRDLVVDSQGRAQIYNGTFDPRLSTYDPVTNQLTHSYMPYWSSSNGLTAGGMAALNDFVYATDQRVKSEPSSGQGLVRFSTDNLDAGWTKNYDADIGDALVNTSTSIPHASIHGTGDGSLDYYSFTVEKAGARGIFDLDHGDTGAAGSFHSSLRILDAAGNVLAASEAFNATTLGQLGSTSTRDAYLEHIFASPGQYLVEVGGYGQPADVPLGASYDLHLSIVGHSLNIAGGSGQIQESEPNDTIFNPQNSDSAERFNGLDGEPLDVAVGLDGRLYTLMFTGSASGGGHLVNVYDPSTMKLQRSVTLPQEHRAIAVDQLGNIFAAGPGISHYDSAGILLNQIANPVDGFLGDIDIKANGCRAGEPSYPCLAVASNNGYVVLTDTSLSSFDFFAVRPFDGQSFVAFTDPPLSLPQATDDVYRVIENTSGNTLTVLSNDLLASGAVATITDVTVPSAGGTAAIVGGRSIRYSPASNFASVETFQYAINDGRGGTSRATVTINVSNTNQNPTAFPDGYQVSEDSSNNVLPVLENDSTLPDVGETIAITAVGTPDQGGTVSIQEGFLIYTPKPDFAGVEHLSYTISDGNGGVATGQVTVDVLNANDNPTAVNDSFTVNPGSANNQLRVLDNDTDAPDQGETLTIVAAGPTSKGGTVSIESGTYVRYTPPPGSNPNVPYQGPDSFTYKISDGNGGVATATVDINVTIVNNPPIAVDDSYQIARNSSNNRLTVLANDTFAPDIGESLTITQFTRPGNGEALQVIENGTVLQYSPPASFTGIQTLTYTVTDGRGSFATATVTIDVGNFNSSPIATNDSYTVRQNSVANLLLVLANDFDPDGTDVLTFVDNGQYSSSKGGLVSVAPDGSGLLYTAPRPFLGTDSFVYTIQDGRGGTSQATVDITVLGWQNPANPLDVDNDTFVVSQDALILLSQINGAVEPPVAAADGKLPDPPANPPYFYDVNDDGYLTALDVLQIVNAINTAPLGGSGSGGEGEGDLAAAEFVAVSNAVVTPSPAPAAQSPGTATPSVMSPLDAADDQPVISSVAALPDTSLTSLRSARDRRTDDLSDELLDLLSADVAPVWVP